MLKNDYDRYKKFYDLCLRLDIPYLSSHVYNKIYDEQFFIEANQAKTASANKVAEIITKHLNFDSVFDIGCGMGIFIDEFYKLGKEVLGCDLSAGGLELSSKNYTIFNTDVTKPIFLNRKYDLVVCFEVAEHIPGKYSQQLVKNCSRNGRLVAFTAAPPRQGGVGHINEQPYEFWIDLFKREGFAFNQTHSQSIRDEMKDNDVVWWIANNFMYFYKS